MFQFTIRDLLLVTVIVALYIGWIGDRHEMGERIEGLKTELHSATIRPNLNLGYQRGRVDGLPLKTEY